MISVLLMCNFQQYEFHRMFLLSQNYLFEGKLYTKGELLETFNIASTSFHRNSKKGMSIDDIVKKFRRD